MWLRRDSQRFVKDVWGYPIRVRNVRDAHPGPDDLVTMQSPVDSPANRAHRKETGDQKHECQHGYYQPLFSSQVFHLLIAAGPV